MADIEEETWYRIKTGKDDTEELYPLVGSDYEYEPSSAVIANDKYMFSEAGSLSERLLSL